MKLRSGLLFAALFSIVVLGACDSGDPIDEPEPRDVAGRYIFTEFSFQPNSSAVEPINVLDTLEVTNSTVDLSSDGIFYFAFKFIEGDQYFVSGQFGVTAAAVRIDGDRERRVTFNKLLLDEDFTLQRASEGVLTAEIPKTIDPAIFSDRYQGINSLTGTLRLRLARQ